MDFLIRSVSSDGSLSHPSSLWNIKGSNLHGNLSEGFLGNQAEFQMAQIMFSFFNL